MFACGNFEVNLLNRFNQKGKRGEGRENKPPGRVLGAGLCCSSEKRKKKGKGGEEGKRGSRPRSRIDLQFSGKKKEKKGEKNAGHGGYVLHFRGKKERKGGGGKEREQPLHTASGPIFAMTILVFSALEKKKRGGKKEKVIANRWAKRWHIAFP